MAMVAILESKDRVVTGVHASELGCHNVSLGATAGEEDAVEVVRHLVGELLSIESHLVM